MTQNRHFFRIVFLSLVILATSGLTGQDLPDSIESDIVGLTDDQKIEYLGAIHLHYRFDHEKAMPPLQQALENASLIADTTQMAYAFNNLGDAFYLTGHIPRARQYGKRKG